MYQVTTSDGKGCSAILYEKRCSEKALCNASESKRSRMEYESNDDSSIDPEERLLQAE